MRLDVSGATTSLLDTFECVNVFELLLYVRTINIFNSTSQRKDKWTLHGVTKLLVVLCRIFLSVISESVILTAMMLMIL